MIDIKNISYIRYAIENPLYKRVDEMTKHRLCGGKNIIYIVPNRYNASIRYRAENMLRTINRLSGYKAYLFEMANMNVLLSNLELVNMVIFQRVICYEIDKYLNCIREKDIPILYDIDDWRFNKDCNHDKRHELNLYLGNMYGTILSQVDIWKSAYVEENNRVDNYYYRMAGYSFVCGISDIWGICDKIWMVSARICNI